MKINKTGGDLINKKSWIRRCRREKQPKENKISSCFIWNSRVRMLTMCFVCQGNTHQNILSKWPKGCHLKFSHNSFLLREDGNKKLSVTYEIQKIKVSPKRNIECKRNSSIFSCVLLVLIETSPVPYLVFPSQWVEIPFKRSFPIIVYLYFKVGSSCRIRRTEVECVNENNSIQMAKSPLHHWSPTLITTNQLSHLQSGEVLNNCQPVTMRTK